MICRKGNTTKWVNGDWTVHWNRYDLNYAVFYKGRFFTVKDTFSNVECYLN